jgi:hypothetical protein
MNEAKGRGVEERVIILVSEKNAGLEDNNNNETIMKNISIGKAEKSLGKPSADIRITHVTKIASSEHPSYPLQSQQHLLSFLHSQNARVRGTHIGRIAQALPRFSLLSSSYQMEDSVRRGHSSLSPRRVEPSSYAAARDRSSSPSAAHSGGCSQNRKHLNKIGCFLVL